MVSQRIRRWLRFSVRTLLIAVTIFCVWLGWQVQIVRERKACLRWIAINNHQFAEPLSPSPPRYALSWHRRMLGDSGLMLLILRAEITDADLKRLQRAFPEATVLWKSTAKRQRIERSASAD
jgi:hypothetical protein